MSELLKQYVESIEEDIEDTRLKIAGLNERIEVLKLKYPEFNYKRYDGSTGALQHTGKIEIIRLYNDVKSYKVVIKKKIINELLPIKNGISMQRIANQLELFNLNQKEEEKPELMPLK